MFDPAMELNAQVVVWDGEGKMLKVIKLYNAYCVSLEGQFNATGLGLNRRASLRDTLHISPQAVDINGLFHDNDWPGPSPIVDWDWTTMNEQCNPDAKARQEQAPASVSGGGPGPKNKPKPREGFQLPTLVLPPRLPPVEPPGGWASGLMKRLAEWVLARSGALLAGIGVFVVAVLFPHDAGVTNEWAQKLPDEEEARWRELEKKRRELAREGKVLPVQEQEEWLNLEERKFPYGRDDNGPRPRRGSKLPEQDLSGATGLIGKDYENFLMKNLPNSDPSFSKSGREFDGAYDNGKIWFEAKSGRYWEKQVATEAGFAKFKSDMGQRLQVAKENGAEYVLFSNTSIPQKVKDYLNKKGIKYHETLN